MATYTQYSQSWLEDSDSIKVVLVVAQVYNVTNSTTDTLYFSNSGYVTSDGLISFDARIRRNVTLSETLSSEGTGAMTFGDIELDNQNGELDVYLDNSKYVWSNKPLQIYYGDPRWECSSTALSSTFLTIFNGITDDVDSRNRASLNLKIRDKLERLNTAVTEDKLGTVEPWGYGGQQNQNSIKPLIFGEVFNISPLLINTNYGTSFKPQYQFNNGVSEQLIEIRDTGVPLYNNTITNSQITVSLETGTFVLRGLPKGAITCSAQGVRSSIDLAVGDNTTTLTLPSNITQSSNTVTKTGTTDVWDSSALVATPYVNGAVVEITRSQYTIAGTPPTTAQVPSVIGLSQVANTSQIYTSSNLDYAFVDTGTALQIYRSGTQITTLTGTMPSFTSTSKLVIKYNGYTVAWYVDDTLVHYVTATPGLSLYGILSLQLKDTFVTTFRYKPYKYVNTIANLVALIVTEYGKVKTTNRKSARLLPSELDYANLSAFNTANPQAVGVLVADTQNVLTLCRALAGSVLAQLFITRAGLLQLLRYGVPYTSSTAEIASITEQDIKYNSLVISSRPGLQAAYKLGYARNYTVQTNLLSSIPDTHKDSFAEEWFSTTKTDDVTAGLYSLTTEVAQVDSHLITSSDADLECQSRLNYYKTQHTVYKFTGTPRLLGLQLGQAVTLTHSRFNLTNGPRGQVVSLSPNWTTGSVEVEVLI
jgi:hypothetical protein